MGGTVSGLVGPGLVLASGGAGTVTVDANGNFTLPTGITQGTNYAVTVNTQPTNPSQTCTVAGGSGAMGAANVTNVAVTCVTNTYTIGGTVSGVTGTGLALLLNGGGDQLTPANGAFTFATPFASGRSYEVLVVAQPKNPAQTCTVANATGTVGGANIGNVTVNCTINQYSVSGTVSGLVGSGLTLQVNNANDLAVNTNGTFQSANVVASGQNYTVTIKSQPATPAQTCVLFNPSGTVNDTPAVGVVLNCTTSGARFAYVAGGAGIYCYGINGVSRELFPLPAIICDANSRTAVEVDPLGKHAYAVDSSGAQILPYTIDQATGALTRIASAARPTGNNPIAIAMHPTGNYLYTANANANNVSVFSRDTATGLLTAVGSAVAAGTQPNALTIDRSGGFLYVTNSVSNNVSGFRINPTTGALTALSGSPYAVMTAPRDVAVDPSNKFAFVTANVSNRVHAFTINASTGVLTQVSGSPFVTGTGPMEIAVDSTAKYLYLVNSGSGANSLSAYSINSTTGALTAIAGSPYARTGTPWGVTALPGAGALYISNSNAGTVSSLSIDAATGAPTEVSAQNASGAPTGTFGITIAP